MRSAEDKEIQSKSRSSQPRTTLGKPTPSKWDDAQKWLVGIKAKPRDSNADDTRLIAPAPQREHECSSSDGELEEVEQEKKQMNHTIDGRSVGVRDMGTEMTPIASKEPSRSGTPIRSTTPVARSPVNSGGSTPNVGQNGQSGPSGGSSGSLGTRAVAWDDAERAKYTARYKREEVKIQAWENHQKRKAEMEMKKMEAKADRLKSRAQEKYANKVAAATRVAGEKRTTAETRLNENVAKSSEKADYIRRTGHLPSSLCFFKIPSFCCRH